MIDSNSRLLRRHAAILLTCLAFTGICCNKPGGGGNDSPTVLSSIPVAGALDVPINGRVAVTFSEPMDPATINDTTFRLTLGPAQTPVVGTVVYEDSIATFWPAAHLDDNGSYEASIRTGARDLSGNPLSENVDWNFNTGINSEPGRLVPLGKAGNYAILAKSGISTVPASAITGNMGISPAAATLITGFALTMDVSNVFSTSTQVIGRVFAADYSPPTPSNLTIAVLNMETAFTDAAGRAPDVTELGAGNIGGLTLAPGVYKWGTGVLIPTDVTLSGSATDVWVFQIAQDLTMSGAQSVILTGGAVPENVFWQVTGLVDLGTTAQFNGVILCATAINLQTGASVNGRLLAQTAVTIDSATVVKP